MLSTHLLLIPLYHTKFTLIVRHHVLFIDVYLLIIKNLLLISKALIIYGSSLKHDMIQSKGKGSIVKDREDIQLYTPPVLYSCCYLPVGI